MNEGAAENVVGAAAAGAFPNAGAAGAAPEPKAGAPLPKTDPVPKVGAEPAPKVGVVPNAEPEDAGVPKVPKAGAAGASDFGAAAAVAPKEKRPLLASAAGLAASPVDEAPPPPKLNTGVAEKLKPPAAGAEESLALGAAEKANEGPLLFFAADSPESSSLADLFVPSVAAVGLTAPNSVGVPAAAAAAGVVFPKVKRLGVDSLVFGAAKVDDAVDAEKLKRGFGASSSDFLTGSDEALGAAAAPKANSGGAVVFGGANALSVDAAVDLPKENNGGAAAGAAASFAVSSAGVLVAPVPN